MFDEDIEKGFKMEPSALGPQECALLLRKALAKSKRFRSIKDVSQAARISYSSMKKYFQGLRIPGRENWRKIGAAMLEDGKQEGTMAAQVDPDRTDSARAHDQAMKVRRILSELVAALDYFKNGSRHDRQVLRERIPGPDVGYLTSLLRALYNEDEFEAWIFFSKYTLQERK